RASAVSQPAPARPSGWPPARWRRGRAGATRYPLAPPPCLGGGGSGGGGHSGATVDNSGKRLPAAPPPTPTLSTPSWGDGEGAAASGEPDTTEITATRATSRPSGRWPAPVYSLTAPRAARPRCRSWAAGTARR